MAKRILASNSRWDNYVSLEWGGWFTDLSPRTWATWLLTYHTDHLEPHLLPTVVDIAYRKNPRQSVDELKLLSALIERFRGAIK
jgi:hypothetical protein